MSEQALVKYNGVARMLHWIIGVAILVQIVLGIGHDAWKDLFPVMPIHKSIGITVLFLSLYRLYWRLRHSPPPLPALMPAWQKTLAHGTHWLFYFMIIAVPLSGWLMVSAGKNPLDWFGLFPIPKWPVEKDSMMAEIAHEGHEIMGLLFIPLLALHIGAALYHHFAVKDDVLRRML
tara:strand:- start:16691 stop:17218 length:528 start_codon:yes stop_codon:yes gene_type:complete